MSATDATKRLRVDRFVYGGYGLGYPTEEVGAAAFVAFALPGEIVEAAGAGDRMVPTQIVKASPERVQPGCPHFGVCGGCHLQMASYEEQLRLKREVLCDALQRAGVAGVPEVATHAADPWQYRNRIRLHVLREGEALRLGYRERGSSSVLPITTCPIAAPLLWETAERLLARAAHDDEMRRWLAAAKEVELFCDGEMKQMQMHVLYTEPAPLLKRDSFERSMTALRSAVPALAGAGASLLNERTGQIQRELAAWGAGGLRYEVAGEAYWVGRGGFFQVNRFLLPTMVELVCAGRSGKLAWDLFAGVGLFARVLARRFDRVTAVEANPAAARELGAALARKGAEHVAINTTTLEFLRRAAVERDRPELIVLDPPRAGAGQQACEMLAQLAPATIAYVSCDPVTLARDLAVLQAAGYGVDALHLVDLFPQTYHQEAVVMLGRQS